MTPFGKGMQKSMTESNKIPTLYLKDEYDITALVIPLHITHTLYSHKLARSSSMRGTKSPSCHYLLRPSLWLSQTTLFSILSTMIANLLNTRRSPATTSHWLLTAHRDSQCQISRMCSLWAFWRYRLKSSNWWIKQKRELLLQKTSAMAQLAYPI